MKYYYVRNWHRFQHYKHRNPPWIKLHQELFTSTDWVTLADASKLLAIVCMLVASRNDGQVPNDPAYLKRVAYLDSIPNLKPLIECGFLSETLADASNCKRLRTNATPETETETETKKEKRRKIEEIPLSGSPLPKEWKPNSDHLMLADQLGISLSLSVDTFRDWARAQGKLLHNWDARFNTWLRDQQKRERTGNGKASASERAYAFAKQLSDNANGRSDNNSSSDYLAIPKR